MTVQVTATGDLGPDLSITAKVFTDVIDIRFDYDNSVIAITHGNPTQVTTTIAITEITTVTDTISGGNHTWVIS